MEEVKKEVEFFNNYLRDLKRPMLAEAPQQKREEAPLYNHPYVVYCFQKVAILSKIFIQKFDINCVSTKLSRTANLQFISYVDYRTKVV